MFRKFRYGRAGAKDDEQGFRCGVRQTSREFCHGRGIENVRESSVLVDPAEGRILAHKLFPVIGEVAAEEPGGGGEDKL